MKRRLIIIFVTVAITVVACMVLFSFSATPAEPLENTSSQSAALDFTLAAFGNNLALYDNGKLIEVYDDILLSALPPADQTALNEGIRIDSFEQLSALLQDFES